MSIDQSQTSMTEREQKGTLLKFAILEFLVAATWSSSTYYYVLFLRERGMNELQTGYLLAGTCAASLLGRLFWPAMADRLRRSKLLITMMYVFSATFMFTARIMPIPLSILFFSCNTFVILPVGSIVDGWFFRVMRGKELLFGRVRSCFSGGICLMVFVNGLLVGRFGWNALYLMYSVTVAATLLLTFCTKEAPYPPRQPGEKREFSLGTLMKNGRYRFVVVWSTIAMTACALVYNFVTVKCSTLDSNTSFYGTAMLVYGIFEMLCIAISPKLSGRVRPKPLLALSVLIFAIEGVILAVAQNHFLVYLAMPFQGIGFGIFIFAIKYYIVTITPDRLKASAQGTAEAFYYGLGGLVSGLMGGGLTDAFGLSTTLLVGAGGVILSSAFLLGNILAERRKGIV